MTTVGSDHQSGWREELQLQVIFKESIDPELVVLALNANTALVVHVERLTADMKEYAGMCDCGATYRENSKDDHYSFCVGQVAREALKEESL